MNITLSANVPRVPLAVMVLIVGCSGAPEVEPPTSQQASEDAVATSTISLPPDLDRVEPVIRKLIEQQVARIRAADDRDKAAAHAELGLIYEANGLWNEAGEAFRMATAFDPSNSTFRHHLAINVYEAGALVDSLAILERVIADAPDLAPAHQRLGHVRLELGDVEGADAAFREVIRTAPDASAGYTGRGRCLLSKGSLGPSQQQLTRAIQLDPQDRVAHFLLGTVLQRQGDIKQATRLLKFGQGAKVAYLKDDLGSRAEQYAVTLRVRHRKALAQMAAGEVEKAAANLEAALNEDPNNVAMINLLAGAYMQSGRSEAAFAQLEKARQIGDPRGTTYINLAAWYLADGRLPEALEHAEMAVEKASWVLSAHYVRIATLIEMKRASEARSALVQALRLSPADATLRTYAKQLTGR